MDSGTGTADHCEHPASDAAILMDEAGQWRERDLRVLWHPCTQMREHPKRCRWCRSARGEGVWLEGFDGRRYLDAVSSWWTNLFGHAEPRIAAAIAAQDRAWNR
jgi:adenosylmethionine-8-amino-7-oxononanoate aminotransferase